jgi:hypothetical protein
MSKLSLPVTLLAAVSLLSACSFSESSKSSSDSSVSLAESSASITSLASSSRSSESEKQSYDRKIADYTVEYVHASKGDLESFRLKISKLASSSGIANWQEDRTTYVAIGKGLRKANLGQPQYEAFKRSLGDSLDWKMDAITEGYTK